MTFTIERLYPRDFEPGAKFQDIVGLAIDEAGNVSGWAANADVKLGFHWPLHGAASPLIYNGAACEPRGVDQTGRVFLYCSGPSRSVIFDPRGTGTYQPLSLTTDQLSDIFGAGGDSWCVGYGINHKRITAIRLDSSRKPMQLLPPKDDASSVAVAVNERGIAAGGSSFLSMSGILGEALTDRPGRAVIWNEDGKAEFVPGPDDQRWTPQICRAINSRDVVVGSTSPMPPRHNSCYKPAPLTDPLTTRAFVSVRNLTGQRQTVALPHLPGDDRITTLIATAINDSNQIVDWRDGIDCPGLGDLSGVHAILWQQDAWGNWKPERLEKLCGGLAGMDESLSEAHGINAKGQITGKGRDAQGYYAFRLTRVAG